jgi:seryl-tRNA synthetase
MRDDLIFEGDSLFVSKKLKQIDSNIGYKKENQIKLIKNLKESNKEKNKELKNKRNKLDILKKREQKFEEMKSRENSKNNIHKLNQFSSPYHLKFLPKICPFMHIIDNLLIMDNQKAEKVGARGFEYIWKQEKLLKLSNIKPEDISNKY